MSKLLTVTEVKESFPDAFTKIHADMKEFHNVSLSQYMEKYGPEPPEKLIDLHTKFYNSNGDLVAIEPRGTLLHWNQAKTSWVASGSIYLN